MIIKTKSILCLQEQTEDKATVVIVLALLFIYYLLYKGIPSYIPTRKWTKKGFLAIIIPIF